MLLLLLFLPSLAFCQSLSQTMIHDPMIPVDPEAIMTVPEIIRHYGYPVEEHQVVTADGYVLTLHRIPHGRNESRSNSSRPVVFLQHGLLCSSSMWVLNLPHQSAGFIFADAGYDVWMGNSRGNIYSKRHVKFDPERENFWRFSWQEMAQYDLSASIDGILLYTKQPNLYYVGHSQGTLTMFAKQASDPAFATKIRKFFALAPVGRLAHVQGLFHYLGKMYDQFKALMTLFGDSQFLPNNLLTRVLADLVCDSSLRTPLCTNLIFMVSGPDSKQYNNTRIPIYLAHNPAGTSTRTIVHFAQMVHYKRMTPYDLGQSQNIKTFGTPFPPEYDISAVSSPTYLFYSDADWLATPEDVEGFLLRRINSTVLKFATKLSGFNHNDFMWGLRARKEIYDPIANIIRQDVRRQDIQKGLKSRRGAFVQRFRKSAVRRGKMGISKQKEEKKTNDVNSTVPTTTSVIPSSTTSPIYSSTISSIPTSSASNPTTEAPSTTTVASSSSPSTSTTSETNHQTTSSTAEPIEAAKTSPENVPSSTTPTTTTENAKISPKKPSHKKRKPSTATSANSTHETPQKY